MNKSKQIPLTELSTDKLLKLLKINEELFNLEISWKRKAMRRHEMDRIKTILINREERFR